MRNLKEQVKKTFCYQKLFWPFTVWVNCSSNLKIFANSWPSSSNFKSFFSITRTIFSPLGQKTFGNKIPMNNVLPFLSFGIFFFIKDSFLCLQSHQSNHYTYWWPWQCCQNNQLVHLCLDQEHHNIQGYWYLSLSINPYPIKGSDYVHLISLLTKLHKLTSLVLSFGLTSLWVKNLPKTLDQLNISTLLFSKCSQIY